MHVETFSFNPFQTNCFICSDAGEAVLIDPGAFDDVERRSVSQYIQDHELVLRRILLTHGHIDHIFGLAWAVQHFSMGYEMHAEDLPLMENAPQQAAMFNVSIDAPPDPEGFLAAGDAISFGNATWDVVHTPGHSPGSVSFIDRENRLAVVGDVLFNKSIGRTDLWRGSMPVLLESIQRELLSLPDEYAVYCGHGPNTSIGDERNANPFLTGS